MFNVQIHYSMYMYVFNATCTSKHALLALNARFSEWNSLLKKSGCASKKHFDHF